jgi:xanthine dehydrogenase YagS FAD-binding subunit
VALAVEDGVVREARLALGGVATKPWRAHAAERLLRGQAPTDASFRAAADVALADAVPRTHNAFKIELAKRTVVVALKELLARLSPEDEHAGERHPDRRSDQPH